MKLSVLFILKKTRTIVLLLLQTLLNEHAFVMFVVGKLFFLYGSVLTQG